MNKTNLQLTIHPLRALKDNYIWTIVNPIAKLAIVVDPGEATPVEHFLNDQGLTLSAILITHKHGDHCAGIAQLKSHHVRVYAPVGAVTAHVTDTVIGGQVILFPEFGLECHVLAIPGHTLEHVAYYDGMRLFCGDTLFGAGCGRIFEGTPTQMYASLQQLATLSPETLMYCGHEYTLANLRFALAVDPDHQPTLDRFEEVQKKMERHEPTLPVTLREELLTNPFLRCREETVIHAVEMKVGKKLTNEIDVFAAMREWKNNF